MALARYEGVAQDSAGNVIPNATVEVRRDQAGRPVVPLFSDRNGTVPMGNPITTNERGQFAFHVPGGVYYIRVFTGPSQAPFQEYTRRYQAVGTAAERDVEELASTLNAGLPIFADFETLELFDPPENANIGARVLNDPDPAKNGDYLFIVDEWKKQRGLPDTLGRMEVIGGTANAIEAEIVNGVDPGNVVMLFIEPLETNTGAVTINGKPLKNIDGSALIVGQFLAGRSYFLTDEGSEYRLRQEGDVSGIPAGIAEAAAAAMVPIDAAVVVAETKATEAVTARDETLFAKGVAVAEADRSETEADRAELASQLASAEADAFDTVALGILGTSVTEQFVVLAPDLSEWVRYRHDAGGVPTEVGRYPSGDQLQIVLGSKQKPSRRSGNAPGNAYYDSDGRTVLRITPTGQMIIHDQMVVTLPNAAALRRHGRQIVAVTGRDLDDRILAGYDRHGRLVTKLAPSVVADVVAAIEGAEYRGTGTVLEQRAGGKLITARIVDTDGWVGEVAQPRDGTLPTSLIMTPEKIAGFFVFGQSNAGNSGTDVVTDAGPLWPHHSVMFSTGIHQYATAATDAAQLTDLAPARHNAAAPGFLATEIGVAHSALSRQIGAKERGVFVRADWIGSSAITVFVKGTTAYNNLLASILKAATVLARYGRDLEPHIVWLQGESGSGGTYQAQLEQLILDLQADVFAAIGRVPKFLIVQTAGNDVDSDTNADTAIPQLAVAEAYDGSPNVVLAATGYACRTSDGVHYTSVDRKALAETIAMAALGIEQRGTFRGLRRKKVTRTGASVLVDFWNDGGPMQIDTTRIAAAPNYGFAIADATATIASVALTGRDQVTLTLSGAPTSPTPSISYANVAFDATADGWSACRGQLYSSAGVRSPANRRGFDVPADVRFPAARFTASI